MCQEMSKVFTVYLIFFKIKILWLGKIVTWSGRGLSCINGDFYQAWQPEFKHEDLMVEKENLLSQVVLWSINVWCYYT